jgi:hypothetical protein
MRARVARSGENLRVRIGRRSWQRLHTRRAPSEREGGDGETRTDPCTGDFDSTLPVLGSHRGRRGESIRHAARADCAVHACRRCCRRGPASARPRRPASRSCSLRYARPCRGTAGRGVPSLADTRWRSSPCSPRSRRAGHREPRVTRTDDALTPSRASRDATVVHDDESARGPARRAMLTPRQSGVSVGPIGRGVSSSPSPAIAPTS